MRNRDYKIFARGNYYHVYNRGNNKEIIFHEPLDFEQFLKRLKLSLGIPTTPLPLYKDKQNRTLSIQPLPINAFSILAYCLMPNHFHFLIRQNSDIGLDRLITKACTSYAAYYNKRYDHIGHVFQDAFKAKLVDDDNYLTYLSAYIHNNPTEPLEYPYSSFQDYIGLRNGNLCEKKTILNYFQSDPIKYKNFVLDYKTSNKNNIEHLLFEE